MSNYWDNDFVKHLDIENIKTIFEVGSRYGDETLKLKDTFKNSCIHSFECNPNTVEICNNKLQNIDNIFFNNYGLGEENKTQQFYSYTLNNDGASSLLKRIDFNKTQKDTGNITIKTLYNYVNEHNIKNIDILCMDIQGYELNVLKGAHDFIQNIKYIIMEEPKPIIDNKYLPNGIHSKYINAPSSQEIKEFMTKHNFIEIQRIEENKIEDNVMYKNLV
jgi:FkbM family methyltransferase